MGILVDVNRTDEPEDSATAQAAEPGGIHSGPICTGCGNAPGVYIAPGGGVHCDDCATAALAALAARRPKRLSASAIFRAAAIVEAEPDATAVPLLAGA